MRGLFLGENTIAGIFGLQGSGKTALCTYIGKIYHELGRKVYSNYKLNFDFTPVTTLKEAQSVRNGVLLLDEVWMWCHARTSASNLNQEIMKIVLMNRKRNVDIIYTTQLKRTIDVILREVTNYISYPCMVPRDVCDPVTGEISKRFFVRYYSFDLYGALVNDAIVPYPIDVIGSWYNTHEEVEKIGKKSEDPLAIGIGLENDFAKAVKKLSFVKFVDVLPVSGHGSSWKYDVLVYTDSGLFAVDVKSATSHVFLKGGGNVLKAQIQNAYDHKAIPYLAFPVADRVQMSAVGSWWMYPLTHFCYLTRLKTNPRYSKLIKSSIRLNNWDPSRP